MSLENNEYLLAKSVLGLLRIASFARTDALVEESALHRVASRSDCRSPRSPRHRFLSGGSQGGGRVCREILQRAESMSMKISSSVIGFSTRVSPRLVFTGAVENGGAGFVHYR
jgi:hypothetical protein